MVHLAMNSNAIAVRCAQCLQILELVLSSARIEDLCRTSVLSILRNSVGVANVCIR